MYANCGALSKAQKVLDELPAWDVVSWNALIAGYAQHGCGKEALNYFHQMRSEKGLSPDEITYACTLKACGIVQDIAVGEKIHNEVANQGLLEKHVVLGGALVDMYAKCGALSKARKVLDGLPARNVVSWNALIAGYAQSGSGKEALNCFRQMQQEGISPDAITFLVVLNACNHSGLVDEGQMLFDSMREKNMALYQMQSTTLAWLTFLGVPSHFDKAMRVIKTMPLFADSSLWSALLGSCKKWGNVELGRLAFERAVELDKRYAAAYVLMSNIYAATGMQEAAQNIENMRVTNGARKQPRRSWWADASGKVHEFVVGDAEHPQSKQIYLKYKILNLNWLCKGTPQISLRWMRWYDLKLGSFYWTFLLIIAPLNLNFVCLSGSCVGLPS